MKKNILLIFSFQGIISLASLSRTYLFKDDLHVSPANLSIIEGLISFPWVIKPLWGYITDSFPLFGFRRKSYLIILSFFEFLLWLCLAFYSLHLYVAVATLLFVEICLAFRNVLGGKVVFLMKN